MITRFGQFVRGCSLDRRVSGFFKEVVSCQRTMSALAKPKVFITRRVPESGPLLLKTECEVTQWNKDDPIPRNELLSSVKGVDALFCLLTEKIDKEVLDAAGEATQTDPPLPPKNNNRSLSLSLSHTHTQTHRHTHTRVYS